MHSRRQFIAVAAAPMIASAFDNLSAPAYRDIDESRISRTIHVKPTGNDATANGSAERPYATIKRALGVAATAKNAGTGVKVLIAPGTYREGNAGENWAFQFSAFNNNAPIVIEGAGWNSDNPVNTGDVIISGSEDWSGGWTKNADGSWAKPWPYNWGVPTKDAAISFGVSDAFLRQELVHLNGKTLYQINPPDSSYVNKNGVVSGLVEGNDVSAGRLEDDEGAFWVVDASPSAAGTITLKLPAELPGDFDLNAAGNLVEVSTKGGIQFWRDPNTSSPVDSNLILRNLTFQHGRRGNAVLIQHQVNYLIEDCRFINNKRTALVLASGRRNGTLRRVECSGNGESGAGITRMENGLLDRCIFNSNSRQGEILGFTGWSVCGIKLMFCSNINMIRCEAVSNRSTGFWWDTGIVNCEMIECISTANSTNGAFVEANNSASNNYSSTTVDGKGVNGIENLGSRPTVRALRCVFAGNKPAPGTEPYRTSRGRGIFFSENENAVIEECLIYDNDIQIGTYDNTRGESRNYTFRNSLFACLAPSQRFFAVGSTWDSQETLSLRNRENKVIGSIKGGWYGLFDGMSATTNDNLYFSPTAHAFPARSQRWGSARQDNPPRVVTTPALTLDGWRQAHLANTNNKAEDRSVDSRSAFLTEEPYAGQALLSASIAPEDPKSFKISRVKVDLSTPLTVFYEVKASSVNGVEAEKFSGSVVIEQGQRSVNIPATIAGSVAAGAVNLKLVEDRVNYFIAGAGSASLSLKEA